MADMKDNNLKTENIHLVGFKLGATELASVGKIVQHHFQKLSQKAECRELKLQLRQHQHAKAFLHEISAEASLARKGKTAVLASKATNYNLFAAVAEALGKLVIEAEHKFRKN